MDTNPFSLLGVEANADEKSLKRAYAALVRQHRPDKDPEAFARVQRAYEAALAIGKSQAWSSENGAEESLAAFEPERAVRSQPIDDSFWGQSEGDGEGYVAFAPPMTLGELVSRVGEQNAVLIVCETTDELLLSGQADYLGRELSTDTAERLLTLDLGLESALLKTAACLAFSAPDTASGLIARVKIGHHAYEWEEGRALLALSEAESFQRAGCASLPTELYRLVTLLLAVDPGNGVALIDDALRFAQERPKEFSRQVMRLSPRLVGAMGGRELDPSAHDDDAGAPSEAVIKGVLKRIVRGMHLVLVQVLWRSSLFASAILGVVLLAPYVHPWVVVGGIGVVTLFFPTAWSRPIYVDRRLYLARMQRRLLEFILQSGVSPTRLVEVLQKRPRAKKIGRFISWVQDDQALALAYRLTNARPRSAEES